MKYCPQSKFCGKALRYLQFKKKYIVYVTFVVMAEDIVGKYDENILQLYNIRSACVHALSLSLSLSLSSLNIQKQFVK
jgi:hypothetical protein